MLVAEGIDLVRDGVRKMAVHCQLNELLHQLARAEKRAEDGDEQEAVAGEAMKHGGRALTGCGRAGKRLGQEETSDRASVFRKVLAVGHGHDRPVYTQAQAMEAPPTLLGRAPFASASNAA